LIQLNLKKEEDYIKFKILNSNPCMYIYVRALCIKTLIHSWSTFMTLKFLDINFKSPAARNENLRLFKE
jgi:hypothetical protein